MEQEILDTQSHKPHVTTCSNQLNKSASLTINPCLMFRVIHLSYNFVLCKKEGVVSRPDWWNISISIKW